MQDELIHFVLEKYPHTNGNNTEICIYLWEEVAKRRGVNPNNWQEMKAIMRDYKPETVTRARRDIIKSTDKQIAMREQFVERYR